jgi:hypothetical protein
MEKSVLFRQATLRARGADRPHSVAWTQRTAPVRGGRLTTVNFWHYDPEERAWLHLGERISAERPGDRASGRTTFDFDRARRLVRIRTDLSGSGSSVLTRPFSYQAVPARIRRL